MTRSTKSRWGALVAVLAVIAVLPTAGEAAEGAGDAANQQAAAEDAEARLSVLRLPPGSESAPGIPAGADPELNGTFSPGLRNPNLIDRRAWWLVPGPPSGVFAWIEGNLPPGSAVASRYYGANFKTGDEFWGLGLDWSPIAEQVAGRSLQLAVSALPSGASALRVDSQAAWVTSHPASERIPAAARLLEVQWHRPGSRDRLVTTERRRFVRGIATLLDRLPVGQPGIHSCPRMIADPPTVTVRFRGHRHGRLLAEAVQKLPLGRACNGMALTIRGKPEPSLEDAGVVIRRLRSLG